jgi:hypothetical protein
MDIREFIGVDEAMRVLIFANSIPEAQTFMEKQT